MVTLQTQKKRKLDIQIIITNFTAFINNKEQLNWFLGRKLHFLNITFVYQTLQHFYYLLTLNIIEKRGCKNMSECFLGSLLFD